MERINRYMSDSLQMAALAHDLRTPMCVAAGAAQMALRANGKDITRQLEQILWAVSAMDRMLGEAQQAGKTFGFTAKALAGELREMVGSRASDRHQLLSIDLSEIEDMNMEADYGALCRVLVNLLINAVKYTQPGGVITLRAQRERSLRHTDHSRIRFIIADNGQGMTRLFMKKMYQPFVRAGEAQTQPGRGLGLSSVQMMVRQMGGRITVRSGRGKGTTFVISVPVIVHETEHVS